jgi:hypothetical protein
VGWSRRTGRPKVVIAALAVVGALVVVPVAAAASNDPTPAQAITELNTWRAQVGEQPVTTADVAAWDTGCQHHNNYDDLNGTLTHQEMSGNPGYTADGAEAGLDSVLAEERSLNTPTSEGRLLPGPVWDGAVFHRAALLEPRLANIGFDSTTVSNNSEYDTWMCLWLQNQPSDPPGGPSAMDDSRTTPGLTLYPSPANGTVDVPTKFPGFEAPDPATETGVPPGSTLGWLMNVEINGPWADTGFGYIVSAHNVSATLAPDGGASTVPLVVSQCGTGGCGGGSNTSLGLYFDGGFGIFPTQVLAANTTYHAAATGTVTDWNTHQDFPFSISWCFSTGAKFTPSSDCAKPASGQCGVEEVLPRTGGTQFACATTPPSCCGPQPGKAGPPTISGSSLSIGKHDKLGLTVHAGKSASKIKSIAISLPHGLSFSSKASNLRKGVGSHGHATLKVHVSTLTVSPSPAVGSLKLSIGDPALKVSSSLRKKHKHAQKLTVVVRVTDTGGTATTLKLKFSVR